MFIEIKNHSKILDSGINFVNDSSLYLQGSHYGMYVLHIQFKCVLV
jgi:hypothetical protein